MNKKDNIKIINEYGDGLQLEFGTEFGYYAKNLTPEQIKSFCSEVSANPIVQESGFVFLSDYIEYKDKFVITARNTSQNIAIPVKLLDKTLYFHAGDKDWFHIDDTMFVTIQNLWRKFMAKNNFEYARHLRQLDALQFSEPSFSI